MRKIGDWNKQDDCERFVAFLRSKEIEAEVRESADPMSFAIWVHDEDQVEVAEAIFQRFKSHPDDKEFSLSHLKAFVNPPKAELKPKRQAVRLNTSENRVTWWLMGACLAITVVSQVPQAKLLVYRYLFFSLSILEGQIWRLVTPALIHTDPIHFIFNMFWLYDLGGDVEREEGSRFFILFFLVVAVLCHIAQFFVSGPAFNGMSGVVYGLLGYVWMMSRYSPASRYSLSDMMMLFMVCWIGVGLIFPGMNMANTQHIVGLLLGLILGSLKSGHLKTIWRQKRRR